MYQEIVSAHERIKPHIKDLELYYSNTLSEQFGANIYFKLESLQRTGSFKIRGALNAMLKNKENCQKGVVTASAGNHAQGVAYSAALLGIPAKIIMPVATPLIKVMSSKSYGAEVELYGESFDEACDYAVLQAKKKGLYFVHPFNDEDVIAGQGTIALEILKKMPDADYIIVPIGGGGLIAGIASAVARGNRKTKVIGVQAENAAGMVRSIKVGQVVRLSSSQTIAEGIAVKEVGDKTFAICKELVSSIVTVTENEVAKAVLSYLERSKLVVEGAGAAPLAALLGNKIDIKGKTVVLVVSGGNIDVNLISRIIMKGLATTGRFLELTVTLKDAPGSLAHITADISQMQANVMNIHHHRAGPDLPIGYSKVTFELETKGADHIREMLETLGKKYEID